MTSALSESYRNTPEATTEMSSATLDEFSIVERNADRFTLDRRPAESTACWSLALSILSSCLGPIGFVGGIVLGHRARRLARGGTGIAANIAWAGLVVGYSFCAAALATLVFHVFDGAEYFSRVVTFSDFAMCYLCTAYGLVCLTMWVYALAARSAFAKYGAVCGLLLICVLSLGFWAVHASREQSRRNQVMDNFRQLGTTLQESRVYRQDNE